MLYGCVIYGMFFIFGCQLNRSEKEPKVFSIPQKPLFTQLTSAQTQVRFKNPIPENEKMNCMTYEYYYNGGGVAVGDVNNDDLPDIFFTGNISPNKFFLNLGNLKFQEVTDEVGLKDSPSWTTGVTMADVNSDGLLDIYICRSGNLDEKLRVNQLFINKGVSENGYPSFKECAAAYGLDHVGYSTQALFFDYDRDGDLDMYLLNHNVNIRPFQ